MYVLGWTQNQHVAFENLTVLEMCKNYKETLWIRSTLLYGETKQLAMTWNLEAGS